MIQHKIRKSKYVFIRNIDQNVCKTENNYKNNFPSTQSQGQIFFSFFFIGSDFPTIFSKIDNI